MRIEKLLSFISALVQSEFARSVILISFGTILGQLALILASPLISRLYTPKEMGVFAVYASTVGVLSIIFSFRYELAIPLATNDREAWSLAALTLIFATLLGVLGGGLLYIFSAYYFSFFNVPSNNYWIFYLLPLGIIATVAYQTINFLLIRYKQLKNIAEIKFLQGVTAATTQVSLGYVSVGSVGLAFGIVFGRSLGFLSGLKHALRVSSAAGVNYDTLVAAARTFARFPKYGIFSGGINALTVELPMFITSSLFGSDFAGFYALAQRVVVSPLNILGKSVAQAYMSVLGQYIRTQDPKAFNLFKKLSKILFLIALPVFLTLGYFAPSLFELIFGHRWHTSGVIVRILSPAFLAQFVVVPLSQTLNFINRQDLQLLWDLFRFVSGLFVFLWASARHVDYSTFYIIYGALLASAYIILYVAMYAQLKLLVDRWSSKES